MKTYGKILLTTLPLVIVSLWVIVETTYFFSRTALVNLGETWLDTRLSEAMVIVSSQEKMLRDYGLADITASITKAQMDAVTGIGDIGVGKLGYMVIVTGKAGSSLIRTRTYSIPRSTIPLGFLIF